jgi:hypothetical protein
MEKRFYLMLMAVICLVNATAQFKKEFVFEDGTKCYVVSDDTIYFGVEDANGKIMVPKVYGDFGLYGNLLKCIKKKGVKNSTVEIYNSKGECKISNSDGITRFDFIKDVHGDFIASTQNLILDKYGNKIYQYQELEDSKGFKYLKNSLTDTIVISPDKFRGSSCFLNIYDVIITTNGNKKGISNLDGTEIIPAIKYSDITPYPLSYLQVKGFIVRTSSYGTGYCGYYNRNGKCILPAVRYTKMRLMMNGYLCCVENNKACIVDTLGKVKFKTKYSDLKLIRDEKGKLCYETYLGNGKGLMSLDGKVIKEPKTTVSRRERNDNGFKYIEVIDANGHWGISDIKSTMIIPCSYDRILRTGYADKISGFYLEKNGFVGFANEEGKVIIPSSKYHRISTIRSEGKYFEVEYNGRKGFCDKSGVEVIAPIYDDIECYNGVIYAKIGDMKGVIDKQGNVVIPFEYTNILYEPKSDCYSIELYGKKGMCDKMGNIIVPTIYTGVYSTKISTGPYKELYRVKDGDTEGYYRTDGTVLFPASLYNHVFVSNNVYNKPFRADWYIEAYNDSKESICYYDLNGNLLYDTRFDKEFDKYIEKGYEEIKRGNYKKAIECYQQALEVKQDGKAYYNIGFVYYKMKKYKNAIKNLRFCSSVNCSQSIKDKASDLIIDCEEALQKRREKRANFWMALVGTGLNITANIIQTNNAIKSHNNRRASSGHVNRNFVHDSSSDYLLDPRVALNQVMQEEWNEYLRMTNGGQTMTYQEWQILKGQALMNANNNGASSSSDISSGSSYSSNSSYSSSVSSGKNCTFCAGLGDCKTCGGRGFYYNPLDLSKKVSCPNCKNQNGICTHCNGTGKM